MTKAFTKNQLVHRIGSWNNRNEFYVTPAVVTGCGQKKMTLVSRENGNCLGRDFRPQENQYGQELVVAGLTDEQALALALELAAQYKQTRLGEMVLSRINSLDAAPAYHARMKQDIAELQSMEPKATVRHFYH